MNPSFEQLDTPQKLLDFCEGLRRRLASPATRSAEMVEANRTLTKLWDAMRLQGGEVPEKPSLPLSLSESEVFVDQITGGRSLEKLKRGIDLVVRWCAAHGARLPKAAADTLEWRGRLASGNPI